MARDLKYFPWLAFLAALLLAGASIAQQVLPDPTRPPAGLQAAGVAASAADAPDALVLQSVSMGHGRIPAAVISGRLVELGGQVGDLRLAHVGPRSVQLRSPQGQTTLLTLVPDGQKTARGVRAETIR